MFTESSELIETINGLDNSSKSTSSIGRIIMETGDTVKQFKIKHDKELLELVEECSKNMLDFEEYKKSAIKYILLAEKLLYPERDQGINAIIYKTGDSVHEAFISGKMDFGVPTKQDSLIFSDENGINYSRIEELEYSKENVERMRIKFLETKKLLTAFIEDNYDDIESSNHITMKYYIKLTSLSLKDNEEDFKEFKNELINFLKKVDAYIEENIK